MPNISISLTERSVEDLDRIASELGLSGRSETIRAAVRSLSDEVRTRRDYSGRIEGVLIAVEDPDRPGELSKARHSVGEIIKAQIHFHLRDGKCAEVMFLSGASSEISALVDLMRSESGYGSVRFVPM